MIGLMDCNNFFVSCERLFRPDLLGKPVAVLSSNDGCIIARSQEVKDLGVPMGIPYFEVKDLCKKEEVTLFSTNLTLYRDVSNRVMDALKSEFETCEVYSVDEAFFEVSKDMTKEELLKIRAQITQKTGIPVSIGIAETKTLAKVANKIAKDASRVANSATNGGGVCILDKKQRESAISNISCGSIWGIGRQTSAFLTKMKIHTVGDLLAQDSAFITQSLGVVGERLCMELRGISVNPVGNSFESEQESYTSTRSFSTPIFDKLTLMSALGHHCAHVAEKLRKDACVAKKLTIILRGSRFGAFAGREGSVSTTFVVPTNDTFVLMKEVSVLFDTLFDSEIPYKKAGVLLSGIEPEEVVTGSLFNNAKENENLKNLHIISDALNQKFGSGTVRHATTLGSKKWMERKNLKSPEYTTRWSQIALIKAK